MRTNPLRTVENPLVDGIYRAVKGRINLATLVPTCLEIASEIEQITHLKGPQKLALLQDVLRTAIADSSLGPGETTTLLCSVDTIVPVLVQAAILASKHPIVHHVVQATCGGWCWTTTVTPSTPRSSTQTRGDTE
jgi:hypothetical protein